MSRQLRPLRLLRRERITWPKAFASRQTGWSAAFALAAAFAVLPTRTLAGLLVGRVFPVVFWSGIAVGLVALVLELRAPGRSPMRLSLATVIVLACTIAHVVIGGRIARLREAIGGPLDALPAGDARRALFGRLHGLSVLGLGLAMLAAGILLVLTLRAPRHAADRAAPTHHRLP